MSITILDKKKKQTDIVSFGELLSSNHVFRIPDYQRGYAWNKEFHDLWLDILRLYKTGIAERKHYTGMVSLEEIKDENTLINESVVGTNAFYVVDGQQRITSLVIILKVLIDYISDEDGFFDLSEYRALLQTEDCIEKFGYSTYRLDSAQGYFTARVMKNDKALPHADQYLSNINDAVVYIQEKIKKHDVDVAKELIDLVVNRIVFNLYFVTENFDVRVAFETMNNRGKKLSKLELLKNRLMYLSTRFPEKSNYGNQLKVKINYAWGNIYKYLCFGDNQLSDDDYLKAHWIVYKRLNKKKGDAFIVDLLDSEFAIDKGEFIDKVREKKYKEAFAFIEKYISSLEKYSKYWAYVNCPYDSDLNISTKEDEWIKRIGRLSDSLFVRASIMVMVAETTITDTDKEDFYSFIELFIFTNKAIAQDKNDLSVLVTGARDMLNSDANEKINKLRDFKALINSHDLHIDKSRIEKAITQFQAFVESKKDFYYSWSGLGYFLYEYNESLNIPNAANVKWYELNSVSIEHVFPQTPEKEYWKTAFASYLIDDDGESQRRITNSLGNLLLLSNGAENSSLSNFSYPVKREMSVDSHKFAYVDGSRSARKIAQELHWTPKQIYERTILLIDFLYEHWFSTVIDKNEWDCLMKRSNLVNFEYTPIPEDDYAQLINRLDGIDVSNERNQVRGLLRNKRSDYFYQNQIMEYIDDDEIYIKSNSKKISYLDCFTFKIIETNGQPDEFQCGVCDKNQGDIRIRYSYKNNNIEVFSWTKNRSVQSEEELDERTRLFLRSFYRYIRHNIHSTNPTFTEAINS